MQVVRQKIQGHFGLFHALIDNAVDYGKCKECNYLMVSAKSLHQKEFIERLGFLLEDQMTERQFLNLSLGMPMVRQL